MFQKMIYRTTFLFVEQMDFFFPQRIAGRHVKACVTSRARSLSRNATTITVASNCCLISYFDAGKFWCIFVHAILKTKPFSQHLSVSAPSLTFWTFSAFLYISEKNRRNSFKISSRNLHNVYNNV